MTIDLHADLLDYVGRVVTAEATWTNECTYHAPTHRTLYLLRNVDVMPYCSCDHVYVELPMNYRRQLYPDQRFTFRAEVVAYTRQDGSTSATLKPVALLRQ
jgi:hypothetical protein